MNADIKNECLVYIKSNLDKVVLIFLLLVFFAFSMFIALNLQPGIMPDEPAHFAFSTHFSSTIGIPPDTDQTASLGWYIRQNPFLYHWIMGRLINLTRFIYSDVTDWQLLVVLRVVNSLFALGTVIICYLLSKEVIKHKWWQLLPVFIITNLLMFVFLSAAVNYDNLANLFSVIGLFFHVRVLNEKRFIANSLLWMIFISLGTLVKFTILPLALAMFIVWLVYVIKSNNEHTRFKFNLPEIGYSILLILLVLGNLSIYGVNLVLYRDLTPSCQEILTISQCELSPYLLRARESALQQKLTISEARAMGYPSPIGYALVDWVWFMLIRTVGVTGHQSYLPFHTITYYQILFYWIALMGLVNLIVHRQFEFTKASLVFISIFYAIVLIIMNYNAELTYGFQQIALQGRYIFPVIAALLVLVTSVIRNIPSKLIRWPTLIFTLGLFLYGGSITIIYGYNIFFANWFL